MRVIILGRESRHPRRAMPQPASRPPGRRRPLENGTDQRGVCGIALASLHGVRRSVLLGQGLYYLATGLWPLVHMRSFEAVTGPKVDRWLVKTVGSLIAVAGASLVAASANEQPSAEAVVLSAGTAVAMALVDTVYAARGRVSPVYLLDAVPEAAIVVAVIGRPLRRPGHPRGRAR